MRSAHDYERHSPLSGTPLPLIASHEELDDMVGRLDAAIVKAKLGLDIGTNLSASGSLATNNIAR